MEFDPNCCLAPSPDLPAVHNLADSIRTPANSPERILLGTGHWSWIAIDLARHDVDRVEH